MKKFMTMLLAALMFAFCMSSCTPYGKIVYAYKLKQGRDSLEKKVPKITIKMVVDQDGNYRFYSEKKGLIRYVSINVKDNPGPGDTTHWHVYPDYDYLEKALYKFGVNQAEKAKKHLQSKRPRDGLRKD